jgi:methanogenic corrinoid protein MtbC1
MFDTEERKQQSVQGILELAEVHNIGRLKRYKKGCMLYCQGDPADCVFKVKTGKVKIYCTSIDGKAHTFEILGDGRIVGAVDYLLGVNYKTFAEVIQDTDVYVISGSEFESLLFSNPGFSLAVTQELARTASLLSDQIRELLFMNVQERLIHGLMRLANEYGYRTKRGIKIDLDLTHEIISEIIAANRSTITTCLKGLKKKGYLWEEGHRLVIIPPDHIKILYGLRQAVVDGNEHDATKWAMIAVKEEIDPIKTMDALTTGIQQVDKDFTCEKLALPDVVAASLAMKCAMPIIEDHIIRTGRRIDTLGTVVIGTVYGDIHDIGKTLVATFLTAASFKVIDLGVNIPAEQFVDAIKENTPNILAMSALMTTTAPEQAKVIKILREENIRDKVKVLSGGGATTREIAEEIGADGYEPTAQGVVNLAKELLGVDKEMSTNVNMSS